MNFNKDQWKPLIVKTVATKNKGTKELYSAISHHSIFLSDNCLSKYNLRYKNTINNLLSENFKNKFWTKNKKKLLLDELNKNLNLQLSPYNFLNKLLEK